MTRGSPASAGTRPATGARPRWSSGTTGGRWSRSTRSSAGPRSRSTTTSPPTACWSTRWSTTATPRSAARPAPSASSPEPTRAAGAGPARARPSAAFMLKRGVSGGSSLPRGVWGDGSPQKEKPTEPEAAFVAVAHGSADPRAAAAIGELMALVPRRAADRGLSVPDPHVAYLGHAAPSVPQVMRRFGPGTPVTVLPLLLTAAYHSKTDIPRVLARCGARVTYGAPLGPHPLLLRALERRLPETAFEDPARTGVVLAAAGSSDPEANATIARLAAQWQVSSGWFAVRPAYASAVDPAPAQAVTELLGAGARRVVVASYLLAPGLFADR